MDTEIFEIMRQMSKNKRAENSKKSTELLSNNQIPFVSKNGGVHLIIQTPKGAINFYPSTGLFNGAVSGRGVFNLLNELHKGN